MVLPRCELLGDGDDSCTRFFVQVGPPTSVRDIRENSIPTFDVAFHSHLVGALGDGHDLRGAAPGPEVIRVSQPGDLGPLQGSQRRVVDGAQQANHIVMPTEDHRLLRGPNKPTPSSRRIA